MTFDQHRKDSGVINCENLVFRHVLKLIIIQESQCTYNVTLRRVRANNVAMKKLYYIFGVCL
jgi:hypothetical protein